jgi:glycosyltransferase involved in cell wall biosynthesis
MNYKNKIKILFIHHSVGWGGAPINMINCILQLDKKLFEVEVLLLKDSIVKSKLEELNIQYKVCDHVFYKYLYSYFSHSDAGFVKPYSILKLLKVLISWIFSRYVFAQKVLNEFEFDIVHLNSSVLSDWLKPASKNGKVIYHIQEPISKGKLGLRYSFLRNQISKYADKVIAISGDNAQRINLPHKTIVVRNFTHIPITTPEFIKETNILYVGGSSRIKGILILIKAIPYLNKEIKIIFAGHYPNTRILSLIKKTAFKILYPSEYEIRVQLEHLKSYKNVIFTGVYDNIAPLMAKTTVLISPFTAPHFSRPVVEAFASGRPVITSNVVGMDELVEDGVDGLIFKNNDAHDLAKKINKLVENREIVIKMGENGRQKATKFYSPEINVAILQKIYLDIIH